MVIDRRNGHNDIAKQLLEKLLPPLERLRDHLANKNLEFEDEMAHQMKFALDREERFVGRRELVDLMWWKINPMRTAIGRIFIFLYVKRLVTVEWLTRLSGVRYGVILES